MNQFRSRRHLPAWYLYPLAAGAAVLIFLGIRQLGTPASTARTSTEVVQAAKGVIQTTVSGSGNVEPGVNEDVNFGTSGTLSSVHVKVGQHVKKGQLLATLDPSSAKLSLQQAEANLAAAEAQLTSAEDKQAAASSTSTTATTASATAARATAHFTGTSTSTTPTSTSTTPTSTTTAPTRTSTTTTTTTTTTSSSSSPTTSSSSNGGSSGGSGSTSSSQTSTTSAASLAASVAQAEAQVATAEATVKADKKAVKDTKLYAPVGGTVASMSGATVGQNVSSGSSGSSSGGSGGSGSGAAAASSSSSSSAFVQIINTHKLTMTVSLSESDIGSVKVGQTATVTISALSGVELGAHVASISPLGTSSSGVVSYSVQLTIDQHNSKVLPGMSATASIIISQAHGVTVPNQAISGSGSNASVQLSQNGKTVTRQVVVGLRGSSRSQILSGLKAGDQVVVTITLPSLGTSSSSSNSNSSGTLGGGGLGGGLGGRAGFRALFRGGAGG